MSQFWKNYFETLRYSQYSFRVSTRNLPNVPPGSNLDWFVERWPCGYVR